ncbi:hypothetical protein [Nocardioides aquiterrae]|uniref:Uncharacterized protein n=1 Tax=Nocardioides aquiterrae TaxID=203799 RepID=A0ABN1UC04_9ACTN
MSGRTPESDWERRKRRAEVFGETLPETTTDERDESPAREGDGDQWLREQVPPHHGKT